MRADLLAEAVLESAWQLLLVPHAAGAAVLSADHLLAPVVPAVAGTWVAAPSTDLLLDMEGGATAPPAARVRLLDLLLQRVLGTHGLQTTLRSGEDSRQSLDSRAVRLCRA